MILMIMAAYFVGVIVALGIGVLISISKEKIPENAYLYAVFWPLLLLGGIAVAIIAAPFVPIIWATEAIHKRLYNRNQERKQK